MTPAIRLVTRPAIQLVCTMPATAPAYTTPVTAPVMMLAFVTQPAIQLVTAPASAASNIEIAFNGGVLSNNKLSERNCSISPVRSSRAPAITFLSDQRTIC
jgi:hypothetical protein